MRPEGGLRRVGPVAGAVAAILLVVVVAAAASQGARAGGVPAGRWLISDLGNLGTASTAAALNEHGEVVGPFGIASAGETPSAHAFLWSRSRTKGKMRDLGTPPLGGSGDMPNLSEARTIGDRGEVIGISRAEQTGPAGAYGAATGPLAERAVRLKGQVMQLKAENGRAIVLTKTKTGCADVLVWTRATRTTTRVARYGCPPPLAVALAGTTAAWLMWAMGNKLEMSVQASPNPYPDSYIRGALASTFAPGQGYSGPQLANLYGDGGHLVYNVFVRCQPANPDIYGLYECPPGYPAGSTSSEQIMFALPGRPRPIATSDHDLTVLAFGGGRVIARLEAGDLIVLEPKRTRGPLVHYAGFAAEGLIATYPYAAGEAIAAVTDGYTLGVLREGVLDLIPLGGSSRGQATRHLPDAASYGGDQPPSCLRYGPGTAALEPCYLAALRLTDLDRNIAVYIYRNVVYLLNVATGRSIILAKPAARPVNAQLEPDGLYISAGKTLTFTPRSRVEQQLQH